jgi:NAD(P)-dependent dehydrogenase (short-subunit alcohol dehydrogenase family)
VSALVCSHSTHLISNSIGIIGACEDQDDHDLRSQFDTNLFGTINILNSTLSHFRENRSGRYLIFSSTAGALGVPGMGPFSAAKFAVEGLLESMLYEVAEFNIKATLIEPGHMRMDEPDSNTMGLRRYSAFSIKESVSEPYAAEYAPARHSVRVLQWLVDRQPVSVVRSAEVAWQIAHCSYPPLRLLLGTYAVDSIRDRLRCVTEEVSGYLNGNLLIN